MSNNAQSQKDRRAPDATPGTPSRPKLDSDDIWLGLRRISLLSWGIDQLMHFHFNPSQANAQLHECTWAMSRIMGETALDLADEIEERGIKS